ncbi:MAG: hypothetical protein ACE5FZ_05895, partial [Nitrospiria bacterium]
DWLYRKGGPGFTWFVNKPLARYESFITEVYTFGLIEPAKKVSRFLWKVDTWVFDGLVNGTGWATILESKFTEIFDIRVIDGAVNGVSTVVDGSARRLRKIQTGSIQNYMLAMIVGIVFLSIVFIWIW